MDVKHPDDSDVTVASILFIHTHTQSSYEDSKANDANVRKILKQFSYVFFYNVSGLHSPLSLKDG